MSSRWTTKNGKTSKRGLFVDSIWHCDCEPRLPAEKFRVKNGGKNHGRWFYTCQKSQQKRCPFFLWSDDAKIREEAAILNNSKNEPYAQREQKPELDADREEWKPEEKIHEPRTPRTPMKQSKIIQPITPISNIKPLRKSPSPSRTLRSRSKTISPRSADDEKDESFDWSSSADDELAEFADRLEANQIPDEDQESPRKATKLSKDDSPTKRKRDDVRQSASYDSPFGSEPDSTWLLSSEDFPSTPTKSSGMLFTPGTTPLKPIQQPEPHTHPPTSPKPLYQPNFASDVPSPLALEALTILSPVRPSLPPTTEQALIALLNRHDLRTQGILKGREIARAAIQSKEKKIAELQQRIASLETERETSRTVIQHLKSDIAKSPGKGSARKGRGGGGGPGGGFVRSLV
ncbi:hypothetical protein ES702_04878 [subsurface metagenome]